MARKQGTEELMANLPPTDSRDYVVKLSDHRGRIFNKSFFVAGDFTAPGWFVWGTSSSGATQIVGRPKRARCRSRTGHRVRPGWRRETAAQAIVDQLASGAN